MRNEEKALLVAIIFGTLQSVFGFIACVNADGLLMVISSLFSIILVFSFILLYYKYRKIADAYDFIKFLFVGNRNNDFNFFPKLKLYMDYSGDKNEVEIETVEFVYTTDIVNNCSDVTWTMKNVYNNTRKPIKTYYLYSSNEYGEMNEKAMEIKNGINKSLTIDASRVESKNGIQKTPYTFDEPIDSKGKVDEIKISMGMQKNFDISQHGIVFLYPRNYGIDVKHINIEYKIKGVKRVVVKLHEIGKYRGIYKDEEIKSGTVTTESDGFSVCKFCLDKEKININNLYYLAITAEI